MKSTFPVALMAIALAGCAIPKGVQMSVGSPKYHIEPKGSVIAGYQTFEFPVHVTNGSRHEVWFVGVFPDWPFYEQYVRPSQSARWTNETQPMCGVGAHLMPIAPGKSIHFHVTVAAEEAGQELQVALDLYPSAKGHPKWPILRSEPVRIPNPPHATHLRAK